MTLKITIELDPNQFQVLVSKLNVVLDLLSGNSIDPAKVSALTAELKESGSALRAVVEQSPLTT